MMVDISRLAIKGLHFRKKCFGIINGNDTFRIISRKLVSTHVEVYVGPFWTWVRVPPLPQTIASVVQWTGRWPTKPEMEVRPLPGAQMEFWQTWCMRRTENPENVVQFHETPPTW